MIKNNNKAKPFEFRPYQLQVAKALEVDGYKRIIMLWPRRSGKDFSLFYLCVRRALSGKPIVIYYIFPTFNMARNSLWNALSISGEKILDMAPDSLCKKNSSEMRIEFFNGSQIQFIGSDTYHRMRGSNPGMCIFSEYAYQNPMAYQVVKPILAANGGTAIFASTPFAKNHYYDLYNRALKNDDWFTVKLTAYDTKHIPEKELEEEKESMSDDFFQQEYMCSFEAGAEGAIYAKYLQKIKLNNQVGQVPWDSSIPVQTAWDIGVRDSTNIVFFQLTPTNNIRVIDYYENNNEGLEHYVKYVKSKPYDYSHHIAPHDIAVREWQSNMTRMAKAQQLGIDFTIAPKLSVYDGIEAVRSSFNKFFIDEVKCVKLIKALASYRYEWNSKAQVYGTKPLHSWESNACDALRMMAVTLSRLNPSTSPDELDARYRNAMHGGTIQSLNSDFF